MRQKKLKNNIILAIPSGDSSNDCSLVRSILKRNKLPQNLKNEILKPTKFIPMKF